MFNYFSVAFYRGDFLVACDRNSNQINLHIKKMLTHITEYIWFSERYWWCQQASYLHALNRFSTEGLQWELAAPGSNPAQFSSGRKDPGTQLLVWLGSLSFFEPITMFRDVGDSGQSRVICPFLWLWGRDVIVSAPPNLKEQIPYQKEGVPNQKKEGKLAGHTKTTDVL